MSTEMSPTDSNPRSRIPLREENSRYFKNKNFSISTPDLMTFEGVQVMESNSPTKADLKAEIMEFQTEANTSIMIQEAQLIQFEASRAQMEMSPAQR